MERITWIVIWYRLHVFACPFTNAVLPCQAYHSCHFRRNGGFFFFFVVVNADVLLFVQGEVFARLVVHMPVPANGSGVGHAMVKGLMPRGGLVKLFIRVLDGVKRS